MFWEPDTVEKLRAEGISDVVFFLEMIFLAIELIYFSLDTFVRRRNARLKMVESFDDKEDKDKKPKSQGFGETKSPGHSSLRFALRSSSAFVPWIIIFSSAVAGYCKQSSVEYFIPLRPLLLLIVNQEVMREAVSFLSTLRKTGRIFVLYLLMVLLFAAMGLIMFFRNDQVQDFQRGPESTYVNFVRGTLFLDCVLTRADRLSLQPWLRLSRL